MVKKKDAIVPASKFIGNVLRVMQENGYIGEYEYIDDRRGGKFRVQLTGLINNCGVIKPPRSVAHNAIEELEKEFLPARDFGIIIVTTSQGVMDNRKCKERRIGGIAVAYVY